ncbi:Appr-1-p processing protein [bacterium]|nr:Appr-1-p processing protein [bacterium]
MIKRERGNLLEAEAEALVNTVNCVGVMGKGIALQFKQAFPDNFRAYEKACRAKEIVPGKVFVFETGQLANPRFIINFPTKRHWRGNSRIEDIATGLDALIQEIDRLGISSIAVPPLGCGNGGLAWSEVRPLIENAFARVSKVQVLLFAPTGTPDATSMPIRTTPPKMTSARALFIKLMDQYQTMAYRLTLLEIQKLAYFLQEAGEPLRLKYEPGHFGPYAKNLNKVLERIEGHFTRGYGDSQKPDVEVALMPGAVMAAEEFLREHPDSRTRLMRVGELVEGFETPYGMELLASVHWIACKADAPATSEQEAVAAVHAWNTRKRDMFKFQHIVVAWNRLQELNWITN